MKQGCVLLITLLLLSINVFGTKKEVKFHFKFGFVKGGEAVMTVKDTTFNGKAAISYKAVGQTTGLANTLYSVYEFYETIVDAETLLPLKAVRDVKEGNYERYNETLFYHDVDSIHSLRSGWRKVPNNSVDIMSVFFYFLHTTDLDKMQSGDAFIYPTYSADKIREVSIKYLRDERIETPMGEMDTYVIKPQIKSKVLKRSDGVRCYLSKKDKVPVYAYLDLKVGALKAILKSYKIDGVEQSLK